MSLGGRVGQWLLAIAGVPSMFACSSEPSDSSGGGAAGAAGSTSSAGASASGASAGGENGGGTQGGAGASGGTTAGANSGGASLGGASGAGGMSGGGRGSEMGKHCSGGPVLKFPEEVFSDFGGPMSSCLNYTTSSTGVQPGTELSVYDIELASPLTADQPYAFSVKVTLADAEKEQTIELWSADDKCGLGQEKLWEGPMKLGISCAELMPTANHSRLLMAWKGEGSRGTTDIALCPDGSCQPE